MANTVTPSGSVVTPVQNSAPTGLQANVVFPATAQRLGGFLGASPTVGSGSVAFDLKANMPLAGSTGIYLYICSDTGQWYAYSGTTIEWVLVLSP